MSKFIDQIIDDIDKNPNDWTNHEDRLCKSLYGLSKDNIIIRGAGNTLLLSVLEVLVNGHIIPTTFLDRLRLELKVNWWFRTISLSTLMK